MSLLKREADLRTDPNMLQAMEKAEESGATEWMDVVARIQHQVIQEHNDNAITVRDLRVAALRHPEICFWVRFNRARLGHLVVGQQAPDVCLLRAHDEEHTTLLNSRSKANRTVVIAGSLT